MRPLVQAGKLRVLAVTSRKRVGIAADIPTVAEAGYPYLGLDSLIGIYGPRGMSNALRESIAADVRAVIEADPTVASRLGRPARSSISVARPNSAPASRRSATSSPRSRKRSG
jgi:tripartite-type tricarboxylate transporter receptor subunit TctC